MKDNRRTISGAPPEFTEFFAAGVLGFIGFLLLVGLLRDGFGLFEHWIFLLVAIFFAAGSIWIGGKSLLRLRVWTFTAKMAGAILICLGMITIITGHQTEGPSKIWRSVDHVDGLDSVVPGLALLAIGFFVEWLRERRKV